MDAKNNWDSAIEQELLDVWTEHLDRVEVSDHFTFLGEREALTIDGRRVLLHEWLKHLGGLSDSDLQSRLNDSTRGIIDRLALSTYIRWMDRVRDLLKGSDDLLPNSGVAQYFSDELAVCILIGYRRLGSTVELGDILPFPDPESFLDPLAALRFAHNDQELELLRRSLFSRHKVVIHRNVLVHIDRDSESHVFGPTIDTLLLNEWLFAARYLPQRSVNNAAYFEEILPSALAEESAQNGASFLEIGSGNGLLTASFAKNEAMIRRFAAIDLSMGAVSATYRNSSAQRRLPHGGVVGDRGRYIVAKYSLDAVPHENHLVVCNPPYIPMTDSASLFKLDPLRAATVGTDLLQTIIRDVPALVAPSGQLVLVLSEMAQSVVSENLPDGWAAEWVLTRSVAFDVGSVRKDKTLLARLKDSGWLMRRRGGRGYNHNILICVVQKAR